MRIGLRPTEHRIHPIDEPLADCVLELLGLVVNLIPRIAHHLNEEELDQPMPTSDECGEPLSGFRQRDAGIRLVLDEARLRKRLDHCRRGSRRHVERRGELPHWQQAWRRLEAIRADVDGLEVVLDGARRHLRGV
jgi:hypothetical protein